MYPAPWMEMDQCRWSLFAYRMALDQYLQSHFPFQMTQILPSLRQKKKKTVNKEFATFCLNCQIKNLTLSQEIWKLRCRLCRHCTHANIFDLLLHKIENYKYLLIHNIFRKTRTVSLANHQLQLNKNSYNDSYSTDKKG